MKSNIRYIGFVEKIGKWRVIAPVEGKRKTLGSFDTIDEAKDFLVENGFSLSPKNGNIKYPNQYVLYGDYYIMKIKRSDDSIIEVKVDIEDYDKLIEFNWYADVNWKSIYIKTNNHDKLVGHPATILIHRYLLNVDKDSHYTVDHIDGDTLDNRKSNLRLADNTQQLQNQRNRIDNTSSVRNVSYVSKRQKWRVKFQIKGKTVFDECFDDKSEAIKVADSKRKELYGEFERR